MALPALTLLFEELSGAGEPGSGDGRPSFGDSGAASREARIDASLAEAIRGADTESALNAFERLYRRHVDGLIVFAEAFAGPGEGVDAVHDAFAAIWERRATWKPDAVRGVRAYLYASVRNAARSRERAVRRNVARIERLRADAETNAIVQPVSDAAGDTEDSLARVWAALDAFPPLRKQVAMLRWVEGLSPSEIAQVLDIRRNAVDQHLHRALESLRKLFPESIR